MAESSLHESSKLVQMVRASEEAIGQYAALRAALFHELVALKTQPDGPWTIRYVRDPAEGDPTVPPRFSYHTTLGDIIINGQAFRGIGNVKEPETYAPIKSFELLNGENRSPDPGSDADAIAVRLFFLLTNLLVHVRTLATSLPAIQLAANERKLTTDTASVSRLDLQLPVFPYWSRSPKQMSKADFDKVLSDEKPLLDEARLTLHRLRLEDFSLMNRTTGEGRENNSFLTPRQNAIITLLSELPPGMGLEGKEIADKLPPELRRSESTLRRHDFPQLVELRKIANTSGVGYHLPRKHQ